MTMITVKITPEGYLGNEEKKATMARNSPVPEQFRIYEVNAVSKPRCWPSQLQLDFVIQGLLCTDVIRSWLSVNE